MFEWIKNLAAKMAGKEIAKAVNLKEGTPVENGKPWYQSKSIWTAIITAIISAIGPISTAFGHPIVIPDWIYGILGSVGIYSLRTANQPIK